MSTLAEAIQTLKARAESNRQSQIAGHVFYVGAVSLDDLDLVLAAAEAANDIRMGLYRTKRLIDGYFLDDDYDANGALRKVATIIEDTLAADDKATAK